MKKRISFIGVCVIVLLLGWSSASWAWLLVDKYFRGNYLKSNIRQAHTTKPEWLSPYGGPGKCKHRIQNMSRYQVGIILIKLADHSFLHIRPSTVKGSEYEYEFAIKKVGDSEGNIYPEGKVYHFKLTDGSSQEIRGPLLGKKVARQSTLKGRGILTHPAYNLPAGVYLLMVQRKWVRSWTARYPSKTITADIHISVTEE